MGVYRLSLLLQGHMSPMDQPKNVLDMISHFVNNQPLDTRSGDVPPAISLKAAGATQLLFPATRKQAVWA